MTRTYEIPDFACFEQGLGAIGLDLEAAEVHGTLCALLCADSAQVEVDWIGDVFADRSMEDSRVREARELFEQLSLATRRQLDDAGMSFLLLLPADTEPLKVRARALVAWCEGFVYGLGLAGISESRLSGDAGEALRDISEFTRLDLESLEADEASETAYMELQEFLRVAAVLIREELASRRETEDAAE